jgi:hypothetical protein
MELIEAALWWLDLGVDLVPVQPGGKRLVPGFGAYRRRVQDEAAARFWWADRAAGLGLVCGSGGGLVVLDFDDVELYRRWQSADVLHSYTVRTRRGFHVHVWGDAAMVRGVEGLDVLGAGCVAVTASTPGYRAVDWSQGVVAIDDLGSLPLLSKEKRGGRFREGGFDGGDDLVGEIKRVFPLKQFAEDAGIRLRSSDRGRGRWFVARCPFHDDNHPSFWLDAHRGTWGCRACDISGDVINLYARFARCSVRDAIDALASRLRGNNLRHINTSDK